MNPETSAMVCIKVNEPKTFTDLNFHLDKAKNDPLSENSEDRF